MSTEQRHEAYADLTRDQLVARLKVAEDVCVLVGWCPSRGGSVRERAAMQMWQTWASMAGGEASDPEANRDLNRMIPQLAATRDRIRSETLEHFFGAGNGGDQ